MSVSGFSFNIDICERNQWIVYETYSKESLLLGCLSVPEFDHFFLPKILKNLLKIVQLKETAPIPLIIKNIYIKITIKVRQ